MAAAGLGLGAGVVWWWAVVRLAVAPDAGVLEGAVAAGGWGLSLLPVHCVAKARAAGSVADGRWRGAWRGDGRGSARGDGGDGENCGDHESCGGREDGRDRGGGDGGTRRE
ncbi:hypothetical protein C6376_00620 [Streptomyces sp. P3]|uniref:hypothetical protein n=1 Tax=Streptomyces sp. P3 TaxID=2135430 RepID=UPI000D1AE015|nr:hypothetical protein [Streptomyces sp. P3]AVV40148.1 hypothetical protein C6376_00620 [Streptomyces sp. P3]